MTPDLRRGGRSSAVQPRWFIRVCVCVYLSRLNSFGIPQGMSSVYFNKGENCIAAGRLFVEESIHDEFISRVVSEEQCRSKGSGDDAPFLA